MPNGCCMSGADGEEYPGAGVRHDEDCWLYNPDGSPKERKKMARGYRDDDDDFNPFGEVWDESVTKRRGFRGRGRDEDEGVDIPDVEVIRETGQAILVRGKGLSSDPFGMQDKTEEGWFPISQLHSRCEIRHPGDKGTLVITTWMAEKRGLR